MMAAHHGALTRQGQRRSEWLRSVYLGRRTAFCCAACP